MPPIMHPTRRQALLLPCENAPKSPAKADLSNCEKRAPYGRILRRASELAGLNRDQTADALGIDPGQLGRWWSGQENPQTWRFTAHPALASALLQAQAEAHDGAVVKMSIEVARK